MRSSTLFLQLSGLVFLIPIGAVAQNTGTIVGAGVRPGVSFGPLARAPIVGLPYSAQQTIEHTQTLADGTHIHDAMQQTTFYRDSQGRTRTEHRFTPPPGAVAGIPAMIQITDPVAGYSYTLEERNHIARRQTLQSPFTPRSASPASTSNASGA
ncbi:MAG: hypothetical protein JOZ62_08585, partial [Acidobacteriaceae bacterium]|nr:hypothetical protein [Acidobacteriaceae bacterium]